MDTEMDTHLCLRCQRIFTSLESYVTHRKSSCVPAASPSKSVPSSESGHRPDEFFHSLQLQSCTPKAEKAVETSTIIQKIKEAISGSKDSINDDGENSVKKSRKRGRPRKKIDPEAANGKKLPRIPIKRGRPRKIKAPVVEPDVASVPQVCTKAFIREFCCGLCKMKFSSEDALVKHLSTATHWKRRNEDERAHVQMILSNSHLLAPFAPFQCGICRFYFNSHHSLVEHWNSRAEAHLDGNKNVTYNCSACQVKVKTSGEMRAHLLGSSLHMENIRKMHRKGIAVIISTINFLRCSHCEWTGETKLELKRHIKQNHFSVNVWGGNCSKEREIYKCSKCSFVGKRKASVLAHEQRVHDSNEDVSVKLKDEVGVSEESNDVYLPEGDSDSGNDRPKRKYTKTHACIHCGSLLASLSLLHDHIKAAHPDKLFLCKICSLTFECESMFAKHQNSRVHKYHVDGLAESTCDSTREDHSCDQCEFKSSSKSALLFHQVMHQGPVEEQNVKDLSESTREKVKAGKCYKCPLCLEIFKLNVLRSHLVSHTDEKPFPCQWCDESFMAKGTLASHMRSKHGEKKFACTDCPFKTHRKDKLASHMEIHHQKEDRVRTCLCETCGAGFYNRSTLKHHMRLHLPVEMGGKTQICSYPGCRLSFRSPSELVVHTRTHTGERPYLCGNCGYSAKTKHQLTKHERSHYDLRPFKCRHCTYATTLSYHLLRHMRIHTGAKPFSCPYCEYTCNTHENLRKHVLKSKKHVGLSVYKCPHCDYGCNMANELKNHMLNEHSEITTQFNPNDNAFSSVITGIFTRNVDKKDIDHPSTPYVPRTERPGYVEKMKQSRIPKAMVGEEEIMVLTTYEEEEEEEGEDDAAVNEIEIVDNIVESVEEITTYMVEEVECEVII